MSLEESIDKVLATAKPKKLAMWKARQIEDALRREDEYALREMGLKGYVIYIVGQQRWRVASEYEQAYHDALQKVARAKRKKSISEKARADIYHSLNMRRTRYGGWE